MKGDGKCRRPQGIDLRVPSVESGRRRKAFCAVKVVDGGNVLNVEWGNEPWSELMRPKIGVEVKMARERETQTELANFENSDGGNWVGTLVGMEASE